MHQVPHVGDGRGTKALSPRSAWSTRVACAALLLASASPSVVAAQSWSVRLGTSFVGEWRPSATLGVEARKLLGALPDLPTGGTPTEAAARKWMLSGMVSGGVTWARAAGDTPSATAAVQAGVLYRLSPGQRLGAYALANLKPNGYGAVVRYEPMSLVGVQVGWIRLTARERNAAYGGIDIGTALIRDALRGVFHQRKLHTKSSTLLHIGQPPPFRG